MKTAKEWADAYMVSPVLKLEEIIEMAQEEAYNKAIDDCAAIRSKLVGNECVSGDFVSVKSILKLKK